MQQTYTKTVYLDYAATTPLDPDVAQHMHRVQDEIYANPSSLHHQGRCAFDRLQEARGNIAQALGAEASEIIFTGSGTESDNMALYGIAHAYKQYGKHIIISAIEHKAVLAMAHKLESEGFTVTYLPVDHQGLVDVDTCVAALRHDTILVSVMYANNEIGTIQPIAKLGEALLKRKTPSGTPFFHSDACQAVGLLPVEISKLHVDLLTINSSKIYGPKGIGLLYVKNGVQLAPLIVGGDQESGKRAGTENVALACGFARALQKACTMHAENCRRLMHLRDYCIATLKRHCPDVILNGHPSKRLANNIHITIPHIEGESLVLLLDTYGICCATGSACSALDLTPSHVLRAIGVSDEYIHGSIRLSLGLHTTQEDIDYTVGALAECIKKLRDISIMPHLQNTQRI